MLDSGARWLLLCCSRQWGKSTVTALRAVHFALFQPGAMVVMAGPTERQSALLLGKVAGFLRTLGVSWTRDGVNEHSMVLPNGSRLVAVPGREPTQLARLDSAAWPTCNILAPSERVYGNHTMRLKELIFRPPKTHRYLLTPCGWKITRLFSRLESQVFRPAVAMFTGNDAELPLPLRASLTRVDAQLDELIFEAFPQAKAS